LFNHFNVSLNKRLDFTSNLDVYIIINTKNSKKMNIISRISKIVPILMLAIVFQACSSDDDNGPDPVPVPNIVELASATPTLSSLVAALQAADGDLVSVLSGSGPFTVLAPTNDAFDTFLAANDFATLGDVPTDVLANILLNHVIAGIRTLALQMPTEML